MNKAELVEAIASQAKLTKSSAEETVNVALQVMEDALKKGDEVRIAGFGALVVKNRKARQGINPATRKAITIKACKAVAFKPASSLKKAVNK